MARAARIVAAVLLVAAVQSPARASDTGAGCGSLSYSRSASCHLRFRGFPLTVSGTVSATGPATLEVTLTLEDARDTPVVIVRCAATSAGGYASCSRGLPDEMTMLEDPLLQQTSLRCRVTSNGTGQYRCLSGSGR